MEKAQYVILLPKGRESDPLSLTDLYAMARDGRLQHDGMVFDIDTRGWQKAAEFPALRAIFRQRVADAAAKPHPNSMPEPAREPTQSVLKKLAGLFTRPGGAL